jgi:diacylglycerol O-acyltransferase
VKPMNGLDRMFLNVESDRIPMDMFGILLLDPSTAPGGHNFQRFRAELAARLPRIPVFTRRPVHAPFGVGHEHWVVDPHFSIDRHLIHLGAPAPGDLSAVCELALSLGSEPMDRDRPLWQMYYVDGLADGSTALLMRLHHAAIDGIGGTELMRVLSDSEPLPADRSITAPLVRGERVPTQAEMLVRSVPDQIAAPIKMAQKALPVVVPVAKSLLSRLPGVGQPRPGARVDTDAPEDPAQNTDGKARCLLNRLNDSPQRSLAVASLSMSELKTVKKRFGVTINDVVLSVTNGAVMDYLRDRDELPDEPLRVAGPVNIRDESAEEGSGNHFAFMMVAIPDIRDPVERLKTVSAMTKKRKPARSSADSAKTSRKPAGAGLGQVMRLVDALPSGVWLGLRALVNSPAVGAIPPIANYIVSNIPGPQDKLYIAGAEVTHMYGRTMVGGGVGLFIHCLSYVDSLDFGFTAIAELIPDPQKIADGVVRQLELLMESSKAARR